MSDRVEAPWANELRRAGFRDERVISAMHLPRDIFAPKGFGAWNSSALPIGHGQTISHPLTVAQMTSLLIERNPKKVLEIGTGSGFQAAVLSRLCDEVCTVERIQALQSEAIFRFNRLEIYNIKTKYSDGTLGWPDEDPNPTDRLPLTAIRHDETYAPATDETIERDYAPKEALPENVEFVRINGTQTLAQIFTDIRYTAADCRAMSETLREALKHQKFL